MIAGGGADARRRAQRAPDISQMTPRERADRLYDRIMRLAEAGKTRQRGVFAPWPSAPTNMLDALDLDARYDIGPHRPRWPARCRSPRRRPTRSSRADPTHLLGLALRQRPPATKADRRRANGISPRASIADRADRAAQGGLPEYQRHKADIDEASPKHATNG